MSISGFIANVERDGENIVLHLAEVQRASGYSDPVGQPRLTILKATWVPPIGAIIWGGSDSVRIESRPAREYDRIGYTKLREQWSEESQRARPARQAWREAMKAKIAAKRAEAG